MAYIEQWDLFLKKVIFQNSIQAYIESLLIFLGVIFIFSLLQRFLTNYLGKLAKKTTNDFDDFLVALLSKIGLPVVLIVAVYFSSLSLMLSPGLHAFIRNALVVIVTVRVIFLLQDILKYGMAKFYRTRMKIDDASSQLIVSSLSGIFQWVIWAIGIVFVLDNFGVNISTLVAGIGIGGIAVAMASQAVLGDAFGALSIFLDRPFEIGDFIIVDDKMGSVEHIGIKTTRIRSLSGEQLVFANSDLTKSRIQNFKRLQVKRVEFKFNVGYETPLEKLKLIPKIVKDIISSMKNVRLDRIHLSQFGESALVHELVYFVDSADYNLYMDRQQEFNLRLMEAFEKEKIMFAYPSRRLYLPQMDIAKWQEKLSAPQHL